VIMNLYVETLLMDLVLADRANIGLAWTMIWDHSSKLPRQHQAGISLFRAAATGQRNSGSIAPVGFSLVDNFDNSELPRTVFLR
jgi:hypothetical protein